MLQSREKVIELPHEQIHIKVLAKHKKDGIITSNGAEHLAYTTAINGHRYCTCIARLRGDDTQIAREGDIEDIVAYI